MQGARTTRTSARVEPIAQRRQQLLRAHQLAGQAVADPDRQRRRRRLALLDHVEMGVEGRDLVDLGLRQPHLLGERREMRGARGGRSGPGSGAGARSAGRAGAAGRRAARAPRSSARSSIWRPLGWRPSRRLPAAGRRCLRISPAVSSIPRPGVAGVTVAHQRLRGTALPCPTTIGRGAHSGKREPVAARARSHLSVNRPASAAIGRRLLQLGLERVGRDEAAA